MVDEKLKPITDDEARHLREYWAEILPLGPKDIVLRLLDERERLRAALSASIGHLQWSTGGWGYAMKPDELRAGMTTLRGYVAELEAALDAPQEVTR